MRPAHAKVYLTALPVSNGKQSAINGPPWRARIRSSLPTWTSQGATIAVEERVHAIWPKSKIDDTSSNPSLRNNDITAEPALTNEL